MLLDWMAAFAVYSPLIYLIVLPSWRAAIILIALMVGLVGVVVVSDWGTPMQTTTLSDAAHVIGIFVPLALAITFLRLRFRRRTS